MKINRNVRKILRRINIYNIAIVVCAIVVIVALIILLKPSKQVTPGGVEVVDTKIKNEEAISEDSARKVAVKQFKKLGEKNVKANDLAVKKIQRSGEEYYYIRSSENTLEIKINSGKITRINSATVTE